MSEMRYRPARNYINCCCSAALCGIYCVRCGPFVCSHRTLKRMHVHTLVCQPKQSVRRRRPPLKTPQRYCVVRLVYAIRTQFVYRAVMFALCNTRHANTAGVGGCWQDRMKFMYARMFYEAQHRQRCACLGLGQCMCECMLEWSTQTRH